MSHIDEGELTAYADGAWAPEDAEAVRIAAHLAECANCRNRLAQEQALSGRAAEILAIAAPAMTDVPTFAEVAARAETRVPRRRRIVPLSWAASVILAVGLGWFGRDVLYRPESASPIRATTRASAGSGAGDRASEPGAGAGAGASVPPVTETVADAVRSAPSEEPVVTAAAGMETANAFRMREQDAAREAKIGDLALIGERKDIEYITAAEAESRRLPLRMVPELEVIRVGVLNGAVQVEQKLPDGIIVTVTARTAGEDASGAVATEARRAREDAVEGARATGRAEMSQPAAKQAARAPAPAPAPELTVVVTKGTTTVTISGALPADSLRALAARIR